MEKTILKIKNLPVGSKSAKIRDVMKGYRLGRIEVVGNIGYVEMDGGSVELQRLGGEYNELKIPGLGYAQIELIDGPFDWPANLQSDNSSNESSIEDLSVPDRDNLLIIKNCDPEITKQFTYTDIKINIFSKFKSVNRILNADNYIIVQLLDGLEKEIIQNQFPQKRVQKLGKNAIIDLLDDDYDIKKLAWEWDHHQKQLQKIESDINIPLVIEERKNQAKYLHEESLPKLDKMTSLEQNFEARNSSFNQIKRKWETGEIIKEHYNSTDYFPNLSSNSNLNNLGNQKKNTSKTYETNMFQMLMKPGISPQRQSEQVKIMEKTKPNLIIVISMILWAIYVLIL